MKQVKVIKLITALLLVGAAHIALGAFTGTSEKRSSSLYSLKSFNRNFYKNISGFSLRSGFQYSNTRFMGQKKNLNGDFSLTSMMRFEKGNTTYIYPYTHKIVLPKFKTPARPTFR